MRGFGQRSSRERRREKDVAENRRWLHTRLLSYCVAVAAVACGGDKATGPAPCDTYTGGVIGSATLVGTYDLTSFCEGMKPDVAGVSGTVSITPTEFTADVTRPSGTTTYSGAYTISDPDGITVVLTSPVAGLEFVGTYRVTTDALYVSGAVGTTKFSFIGTRVVL